MRKFRILYIYWPDGDLKHLAVGCQACRFCNKYGMYCGNEFNVCRRVKLV